MVSSSLLLAVPPQEAQSQARGIPTEIHCRLTQHEGTHLSFQPGCDLTHKGKATANTTGLLEGNRKGKGSSWLAAVWSQISLNLLYSHAIEITIELASGTVFFLIPEKPLQNKFVK